MFIFHGLEPIKSANLQELNLNKDDVQQMTAQLRTGIATNHS